MASESIESERCGVHEEIIVRERYAEIRERSVDTCAHALKETEAHAQRACAHMVAN